MPRTVTNARRYHLTHAQLAAGLNRAEPRARAFSRRAADIALGAVLVGLGWLVIPYIGG
jgi:hypothetical protein